MNGDLCINVADLLIVRDNMGLSGSDISPPTADVGPLGQPDGIINVADLLIVRDRMGIGCE